VSGFFWEKWQREYEYLEEYNKRYLESIVFPALHPDSVLPDVHITLYPAIMQIHSYVQRVCKTGNKKARTDKRALSGSVADIKM
jgi:hypothetical protein